MATKLTKKQAAALLSAYENEQTAAANASIAAYNKAVDAETAEVQADVAAKEREANKTAAEAYDKALLETLIRRREVAETLGNWGLTRSGLVTSQNESIDRTQVVAQRTASAKKAAALAKLSQRLLTAREQAAAKKAKNTASVQKTLASKVAEKKLTLNKAAL